MTVDSVMDVIREHPFAEELRAHHLERLAALAREVHFRRDEVIFREGDDCDQFYLIASGRVALETHAFGRTFRIQTLAAGDELGWSSMLMRASRHFWARAVEPVRAIAFDGSELLRACHEDPGFGFALMYRLLGVVAERLQATRLQLMNIYSEPKRS